MKKFKNALCATHLPMCTSSAEKMKTGSREHNDKSTASSAKDKQQRGQQSDRVQGLLLSLLNKLRKSSAGRPKKCEKCGIRSQTCTPNASFISGRKHFLCYSCRVSSHSMKEMYQKLRQTMSLQNNCSSFSSNSSPRSAGPTSPTVMTATSNTVNRSTTPESGYETVAASHNSFCSGDSQQFPSSISSSSEECGIDSASHTAPLCSTGLYFLPLPGCQTAWVAGHKLPSYPDKGEVFGETLIVKPSETAGRLLHDQHTANQSSKQKLLYTDNHSPFAASGCYQQNVSKHQCTYSQQGASLQFLQRPLHDQNTHLYDGYLESRKPSSCYRFKNVSLDYDNSGSQEKNAVANCKRQSQKPKLCYRCQKNHRNVFRAPSPNTWLCEDCMDDMI